MDKVGEKEILGIRRIWIGKCIRIGKRLIEFYRENSSFILSKPALANIHTSFMNGPHQMDNVTIKLLNGNWRWINAIQIATTLLSAKWILVSKIKVKLYKEIKDKHILAAGGHTVWMQYLFWCTGFISAFHAGFKAMDMAMERSKRHHMKNKADKNIPQNLKKKFKWLSEWLFIWPRKDRRQRSPYIFDMWCKQMMD